jgi:hypothetical protein
MLPHLQQYQHISLNFFFLKYADFRAFIKSFARQAHHDRLQLFMAQRHATIMPHTSQGRTGEMPLGVDQLVHYGILRDSSS